MYASYPQPPSDCKVTGPADSVPIRKADVRAGVLQRDSFTPLSARIACSRRENDKNILYYVTIGFGSQGKQASYFRWFSWGRSGDSFDFHEVEQKGA